MHENIQKFNEMPKLVTVHFFGPSGTFHSPPPFLKLDHLYSLQIQ